MKILYCISLFWLFELKVEVISFDVNCSSVKDRSICDNSNQRRFDKHIQHYEVLDNKILKSNITAKEFFTKNGNPWVNKNKKSTEQKGTVGEFFENFLKNMPKYAYINFQI